MDKIYRIKDNMYKELAKKLYNSDALDKENYEDILGTSNTNNSKDYHIIEKDDFDQCLMLEIILFFIKWS